MTENTIEITHFESMEKYNIIDPSQEFLDDPFYFNLHGIKKGTSIYLDYNEKTNITKIYLLPIKSEKNLYGEIDHFIHKIRLLKLHEIKTIMEYITDLFNNSIFQVNFMIKLITSSSELIRLQKLSKSRIDENIISHHPLHNRRFFEIYNKFESNPAKFTISVECYHYQDKYIIDIRTFISDIGSKKQFIRSSYSFFCDYQSDWKDIVKKNYENGIK